MQHEILVAITDLELLQTIEAIERVKKFFELCKNELSNDTPKEIALKKQYNLTICLMEINKQSLLKSLLTNKQ